MIKTIDKYHWQKGQSLIEMLVSMFIISTALITIVMLTSKAVQNNSLTHNRETAISLAKGEMERVRSARNNAATWSTFKSQYSDRNQTLMVEKIFYTIITTGTEVSSNKILVSTVISWSDVKGFHEVTQSTFLTQY